MNHKKFAKCENRRQDERLKHNFSVKFQSQGSDLRGQALNVSASGLRFISEAPCDEANLKFTLQLDGETTVEVTGKPVWQRRLGTVGKAHIVGVSFNREPVLTQWLRGRGVAA